MDGLIGRVEVCCNLLLAWLEAAGGRWVGGLSQYELASVDARDEAGECDAKMERQGNGFLSRVCFNQQQSSNEQRREASVRPSPATSLQ